jgi:hypothetical protein
MLTPRRRVRVATTRRRQVIKKTFVQRAAFALGQTGDGRGMPVAALTASSIDVQARAWEAYTEGYLAHARQLEARRDALRAELAAVEAELADATSQAQAAKVIAACLRAPWRRRRPAAESLPPAA